MLASLDQLADTPEFRQWLEQGFPKARRVYGPGFPALFRQDHVSVVLVRRSRSDRIPPSVERSCRSPVRRITPTAWHGITRPPCRPAQRNPLVLKSHEGGHEIEGNPDHPDSNGGTDQFAQASILNLYDRIAMRLRGMETLRPAEAVDTLAKLAARQNERWPRLVLWRSAAVRLRERQPQSHAEQLPNARWHVMSRSISISTG